jgi:hypothetical protein
MILMVHRLNPGDRVRLDRKGHFCGFYTVEHERCLLYVHPTADEFHDGSSNGSGNEHFSFSHSTCYTPWLPSIRNFGFSSALNLRSS